MALATYQPIKAIWTLFAVVINAARLPIWLVYYLPTSLRPHPKWTYKQTIMVQVVKNFLWNASMVEMKTPLSFLPKAEKERWVVIRPGDKLSYMGVVNADPNIVPVSIGGTWYPVKPSVSAKPALVILHFHGGAFVIGDGRSHDAGFAAKTLIANTAGTHVFAPQYRLSCNPGCRFPAALQDAITAYIYLIKVEGIAPSKIVFSGDSAGGNLALSLTRYLTEHGDKVGLPGPLATLLWSPWVSPRRSMTPDAFYSSPNIGTDYVTYEFGNWGARVYQPSPKSGLTIGNPYIDFLHNPFKTPTPIYISTGECEVLLADNVKLAEQMRAAAGNTVELTVEGACVHDTILTGKVIGFEKEAERSAKRAGEFLQRIQLSVRL